MSKIRRTIMFVPGNNPKKLQSAGIYRADSLVFDLEDSVAVTEKDAARILVRNAIRDIEYPCEVGVRINALSTPYGYDDLQAVLPAHPAYIRLPKAEVPADVQELDAIITTAETENNFAPGSIKIMLSIESAKGILNALSLASASPRVVAIGMGAEDLMADLKGTRSNEGKELAFAKGMLLFSARAAGVQAIDNVFADVKDEAAFIAEVTAAKAMGYDGKSVIHPAQVPLVHKIYAPTTKEIDNALRVVAAYQQALANKSGVIAIDGKMIDGPIVTRAERVLQYAKAVGLTKEAAASEECSR